MPVTSTALHLDCHLSSPLLDDDVVTYLILSSRPVLFLLQRSERRVTAKDQQMQLPDRWSWGGKENWCFVSPRAKGHDCHILFFPPTLVCVHVCVNKSAESHVVPHSHPTPILLSLSNRLRLSEVGPFLQFVPTSLLNHLHYLTVFSSKGAPTLFLSASLMKACMLR